MGIVIGLSLLVSGCYLLDTRTQETMPTVTLAPLQPSASSPLFIVLPGRGDNLEGLRRSGIGNAIQQAIPEAEVILAGATMAYYREGRLIARLHEGIIVPARARGRTEIWLVGISLGGMGAILYDREHPRDLQGLVLFSPYMGESDLVSSVAAAGGPHAWDPGPVPQAIDKQSTMRQAWLTVKRWSDDATSARRVWLTCGQSDRLRKASALLAALLPQDQVFNPPGGHEWRVWLPASRQVFAQIEARRLGAREGGRLARLYVDHGATGMARQQPDDEADE